MDIVLGVAVATTTVRMVLIEGERADGVIIESETFDTANGVIKASPSEQISAAIRATQQNALARGHHLVVTGVSWDHDPAPDKFSDSIAARDLQNVIVVAEQHATGALAQNVGRALGFDTIAVMVMGSKTATLSVVDSDSGSLVEARMCAMDDGDPAAIMPTMAAALESADPKPGSVFVVGPRPVVTSVKSSLERLIPQPVIVPEEPEFALARGAALAAASAPGAEGSTCGLAYSQDPDEPAAIGQSVKLADAETQAALFDSIRSDVVVPSPKRSVRSAVRIPIGSTAAAVLVVGAVTLAMSVAGNVRPTIDRESIPAGAAEASAPVPEVAVAPELPVAQAATVPAPAVPLNVPVAPPAAQVSPVPPSPAPPAPTQKPIVPVRQPTPQRVVPQPTPVAAAKPLPVPTPVAAEPEVAAALPAPAAVQPPPPPVLAPPLPPPSLALPAITAPAINPVAPSPASSPSPWMPPWLWIGTPPQQQVSPPLPGRQWLPNSIAPQQDIGQWPQQRSPGLQIFIQPRQQPVQTLRPPQVPLWTPAPLAPQWTQSPSTYAPQAPATTRSPYTYTDPIWPEPSNPSGVDTVPRY